MPKIVSTQAITAFPRARKNDASSSSAYRPRRNLRLPEETHPAYDAVRRWDAEKRKLRHISQVSKHPQLAKEKAKENSDTLQRKEKRPSPIEGSATIGFQNQVPPKANEIIETLRSCKTNQINPGKLEETSTRLKEPRLLSFKRRTLSPAKTYQLPKETSTMQISSERQRSNREDATKKIRRSKSVLLEVLKKSGEVLRAKTTRRKVKNLEGSRRISIPEDEILRMTQELERESNSKSTK